jgi:hypothetical protein
MVCIPCAVSGLAAIPAVEHPPRRQVVRTIRYWPPARARRDQLQHQLVSTSGVARPSPCRGGPQRLQHLAQPASRTRPDEPDHPGHQRRPARPAHTTEPHGSRPPGVVTALYAHDLRKYGLGSRHFHLSAPRHADRLTESESFCTRGSAPGARAALLETNVNPLWLIPQHDLATGTFFGLPRRN